ncbi:hypothetical protein OSB04_020193 [Centaurea solstitialis]|uniref:Reverse transcriptase Ty1/copia-type domain-containing protein n=1 Tax=Centaurea solstitialis TaxID=347529 RepID=A0AA38SRR9_9ASTR|nr:hypothetical protein OSB04_020193 [Centaurea solstitialis]
MLEYGFKINDVIIAFMLRTQKLGMSYVDGMLIIGSHDKMDKSIKNILKTRFDMKILGLADVILEIQISRILNEFVLSQAHYVDKIIEKFNANDTIVARIPIDTIHHLSKNRGEGVAHKSITHVLRYLRYNRDYGLHYSRYLMDLKDSKSTSGDVFTLRGAAISWKSSKQMVIARSTMESEFIALDKYSKVGNSGIYYICIHCDIQSTIGRAKSAMYNGKSRHIRRRHNTIKQLLPIGVTLIVSICEIHTMATFPSKDSYFDSGSLAKPPRFMPENFPLWKSRMELFLAGADPQIPYFIEHGPHVPTSIIPSVAATDNTPAVQEISFVKLVANWSDEDRRLVNIETKARSLIAMSLPDEVFHSISKLKSAKEIWDTLCLQYEGADALMESRKIHLIRQYEKFITVKGETLSQTHQRFNCLLIDLKTYDVSYSNSQVITKLMEALPDHWENYTMCLKMSKT